VNSGLHEVSLPGAVGLYITDKNDNFVEIVTRATRAHPRCARRAHAAPSTART